jgi:hypothetical protein
VGLQGVVVQGGGLQGGGSAEPPTNAPPACALVCRREGQGQGEDLGEEMLVPKKSQKSVP